MTIRLDGVAKALGGAPALEGVDLHVPAGRFLAVLGPSGCGKTTLLRLIDGLVAPDRGTVLVDGRPPRPGPNIGFVFQSFRLVPWLTARDNAAFGLAMAGVGAAERRARAERALDAVGLSRFADRYPDALSGGMRQRVALARALAGEPGVLLLDEPFASLDAQTRDFMHAELLALWDARRITAVLVTHSVDEALALADRVALMSARPGRVLEVHDVPGPRSGAPDPRRGALRAHLAGRIRELLVADPASDFYGRAVPEPAGPISRR